MAVEGVTQSNVLAECQLITVEVWEATSRHCEALKKIISSTTKSRCGNVS